MLDKLGLTRTTLPVHDDVTMPDPHPQGYMRGTNVQGNTAYNAALAGDKANVQTTVPPGGIARLIQQTLLPG